MNELTFKYDKEKVLELLNIENNKDNKNEILIKDLEKLLEKINRLESNLFIEKNNSNTFDVDKIIIHSNIIDNTLYLFSNTLQKKENIEKESNDYNMYMEDKRRNIMKDIENKVMNEINILNTF